MLDDLVDIKLEDKRGYERLIKDLRLENERLKRNNNLLELENKEYIKKLAKLDSENCYLSKRDKTLTALEKSIPQRINTYKKKDAPEIIIKELQLLSDMLMCEKEVILDEKK